MSSARSLLRRVHPWIGREVEDTAASRRGILMNERFKVTPRGGDDPPRAEDACRVGVMRRIAAARLKYCGLEAMNDDVMLIVSELLTNALLHSGATHISLTLSVQDGRLLIAVGDRRPGTAKPASVDENAESGRGLHLVEAVAQEHGGHWGTTDAGATTWCSLALTPEARS